MGKAAIKTRMEDGRSRMEGRQKSGCKKSSQGLAVGRRFGTDLSNFNLPSSIFHPRLGGTIVRCPIGTKTRAGQSLQQLAQRSRKNMLPAEFKMLVMFVPLLEAVGEEFVTQLPEARLVDVCSL